MRSTFFFVLAVLLSALILTVARGNPPQAPGPPQAPPVHRCPCILGEPCSCGLTCDCLGIKRVNPDIARIAAKLEPAYTQHAGYWWDYKADGWHYWNGVRWIRYEEPGLHPIQVWQPAFVPRATFAPSFTSMNCGPRG